MAAELASHHRRLRDPIQLQCPTLADMRSMSMKGSLASPKSEHRPRHRRHFPSVVFEICGTVQQPQPTFGMIPSQVQVEQQGNNFGVGIGMNTTVLAVAASSYGQHGRAPAEIDFEFLFDHVPQCRTGQGVDEPCKRRPAIQNIDGKTAVTAYLREIGDGGKQFVELNEIFDHDKIKWITAQRSRTQTVEIKHPRFISQLSPPAFTGIWGSAGEQVKALT